MDQVEGRGAGKGRECGRYGTAEQASDVPLLPALVSMGDAHAIGAHLAEKKE